MAYLIFGTFRYSLTIFSRRKLPKTRIRNLTLTRLTYVQNVVNFLDCQFYFCWVINHEKGSGLLVFFALIDRGIYGGSRPPNQVWQKSLGLHRLLGSNGHQAQVLVLQNDSFFYRRLPSFASLYYYCDSLNSWGIASLTPIFMSLNCTSYHNY